MIKTVNGLTYEYVTTLNRWIYPGSAFVERLVSKFIAQDIGQLYKFVVTYEETLLACDAKICVFQAGVSKLIPFGCVQASAQPNLASLRPTISDISELTEEQRIKYCSV